MAVPAGTVTLIFAAAGPSAGACGLNPVVEPTSGLVVTSDGVSPNGLATSVPLYPVRSGRFSEPLVPVPETFGAADTTTGRTAIGLRTLCPRRSSQDSEPNTQTPSA